MCLFNISHLRSFLIYISCLADYHELNETEFYFLQPIEVNISTILMAFSTQNDEIFDRDI